MFINCGGETNTLQAGWQILPLKRNSTFESLVKFPNKKIMGLDTVELVMAIEEEFEMQISDGEAERLLTVGNIHERVIQTLTERGQPVESEQIWERVKAVVARQLGVSPDAVTRSARIVEDLKTD